MSEHPVRAGGRPINVGLAGVSAERGWAAQAHIPALRALPRYRLRGIAGRDAASIRAAAERFDVTLAVSDPLQLIDHPDVDLVVVTVKVPEHRPLVEAALLAGKAVYCEWPLAVDLVEAEALADLARRVGAPAYVGLQARVSPLFRQLRAMIREGVLGEILSVSLVGSGGQWGPTVQPASAYLSDRANGATMLSIPMGHALDALCWLLGEFRELCALDAVRVPETRIVGRDLGIAKTAPDQVVVCGVLESGAVVSAHYRGGRALGTNLLLEINGSDGDLQITGDFGSVQMGGLTAVLRRPGVEPETLEPAPTCRRVALPDGAPANVAEAYAAIAETWPRPSPEVASFEDGLLRHRMLAAVEHAAEIGRRATYPRPIAAPMPSRQPGETPR